MKVRVWGVRGSQASPGPDTHRYGGNTSCLDVVTDDPTRLIILDAGTGIRRLGLLPRADIRRIDVLLTHLHMDHIQGLGFFEPLYQPGLEVHLWGPGSATLGLRERLGRYLSPPLFPVRLRDLACDLQVHEVPLGAFTLGPVEVTADLVCHPGPTVGYRIENGDASLAYLPDHEPELCAHDFPHDLEWMSGIDLARGVDVLFHDSQYGPQEYPDRIGWGHSTGAAALAFAVAAGVGRLVVTHFDPVHDDDRLDAQLAELVAAAPDGLEVLAAHEGDEIAVI